LLSNIIIVIINISSKDKLLEEELERVAPSRWRRKRFLVEKRKILLS
jgi:hypothetical protein